MKIKVTNEHIKKGRASSCRQCPIALALIDAGFEFPIVKYRTIVFKGEDNGASLPYEAREFITRFDDGEHVEPFEFELNID